MTVKVNDNPLSVEPMALAFGQLGADASLVDATHPMPVGFYDAGGLLTPIRGAGITASASFTPAAAAYGALDIMDVAKEFAFTLADGAAVPSGSLIRILSSTLKIDTTGLQASEGAYVLQCYGVTPPSAQADNAAWTLASGDLASYKGSLSIGTPIDLGSALHVKTGGLDADIKLTTASLWAELQTTPGFTATAVARQITLHGIIL